MKKAIIGLIALVILVTGAAVLFAQKGDGDRGPGGNGGPGFGRGRHGSFLKGITLTDDQKVKIKAIFEANKDARRADFAAMKVTREKIEAATANGAFDEAAVTAIAKEQADLMVTTIVAREKMRSQIFAILTDEQKAQLEAKKTEFEQRVKDHKGRHFAPQQDTAPVN